MPSTDTTPLILVNRQDQPVGVYEKLQAHKEGRLHRAFSVFLYNAKGELLIQKRAFGKYHSEGLWANTCCGHPCPDEPLEDAAARRVEEELGLTCPSLQKRRHVLYQLKLGNGLYECEYVHIFEGMFPEGQELSPDPKEVSEVAWVSPVALRDRVRETPGEYARWFRLYLLKYFAAVFGDGV